MKLNAITEGLRRFFRHGVNTTALTGAVALVPAGIAPDNVGMWGVYGLIANMEGLDWDVTVLVGAAATAITMTAAQFCSNVVDYSGSPGGPVTVTLPTAAQIIAALPPTIPANGYNFPWYFMNDSAGQTVTLAGGTGVTITGTATVATATTRQFVCSVNVNAGTVTLLNIGSVSL